LATLKYTPSSLRDLATLRVNVTATSGSEFRARVVIERIDDRCATLEGFPFAGRPRPEFKPTGLRSIAVKPNVVVYFYDQATDIVHIMRIIDGRRDFSTIFFNFDEIS
jgi:plasmid stabilization system protein ParE